MASKKFHFSAVYARGDADEQSDIDFLYTKGKILGLKYFGFVNDLEEEFKCHVDLVSDKISDKDFLTAIKNDEVILYEG